jgi:PTH1 family peptidyl-tRNA hydrolase
MKLIVGLGNPGRKYEGTRHNVGFVVLDELAARHAASRRKQSFQGEVAEASLGSQKCLLLWPHTFMNLSGASARAARDFYKLTNAELLVVCDDFNLPLGKLRLRASGTAGGQKGLENILHRLGADDIARLRIGVGPLPPSRDGAEFVLGRFGKDEQEEIQHAVVRAVEAVEVWANEGSDAAMNRFNA